MYWNYVIGLCVELLRTKCTIFSKYLSFWNVVLTLASFLLSICSICSTPRANELQTAIFVAKRCSFADIGFGFGLPWSLLSLMSLLSLLLLLSLLQWLARIFKYSNKMAPEYYLYLHLWHFPSTNIFGYSLVDFWTTEYIQIFYCKFFEMRINLNICSESCFNICLYIFNEKVYLDIIYASKNIQCKVLFRGSTSEHLWKVSSISDKYEYYNIRMEWLSNIIRISICAFFEVQIYLDICLVNLWYCSHLCWWPVHCWP